MSTIRRSILTVTADELGDKRSAADLDRDAKRGNDAVRFASFVREWRGECGHTLATVPECRAVFDQFVREGKI